mgnify:CR=1 FL=1|tara:strand:- start:14705 stop:16066 length:1362 start_codon:yes stop_codon:yes gene_type:complete
MDCPLTPLDGRYLNKTKELRTYFSENAFFKYRYLVEIKYFIELISVLPELKILKGKTTEINKLLEVYENFNEQDYEIIKKHEAITNHDIKALEYFIQDKFKELKLDEYITFIHFGITSQDINTTANIYSLTEALNNIIIPEIQNIINTLNNLSNDMKSSIMLSHTHGQAAVPTTMGKELYVYKYRLEEQLKLLQNKDLYTSKFGGAVGNFNAHCYAYPDINWNEFADKFINSFGLHRERYTTQISNYDNLSNIFNILKTINNIVNDLNIDSWLYISKGYLIQKVNPNETGSSTMPHKVNPIHFENSEGNICIANSLIEGITRKISISRLQRDLTDSTILRNIGVVLGYCLVSYKSTISGLNKIAINNDFLSEELENNIVVLTEAMQTIMRKYKIKNSYEIVKNISRINTSNIEQKIDCKQKLDNIYNTLSEEAQFELQNLNMLNYIGYSDKFT